MRAAAGRQSEHQPRAVRESTSIAQNRQRARRQGNPVLPLRLHGCHCRRVGVSPLVACSVGGVKPADVARPLWPYLALMLRSRWSSRSCQAWCCSFPTCSGTEGERSAGQFSRWGRSHRHRGPQGRETPIANLREARPGTRPPTVRMARCARERRPRPVLPVRSGIAREREASADDERGADRRGLVHDL